MASLSPITASPATIPTPSDAAPATLPTATLTTAPKTKASKPRKRVNTAEKRNQHNAIERARRETLNGRFLSLARLLPSLAASRRPSKSAIVNGSIAHLNFQREQRLLASKLLKQLCAERDELLNEVNSWRKLNSCALKDSQSAWTEEMQDIANVEKEIFGSFASMGDDGDDDEASNEVSEQGDSSNSVTNATVNGLITPRSSTDLDAFSQPSLFTTAPVSESRPPTAGINGINWSADFALDLNTTSAPQPHLTMPFNGAFMADAQSSSPVTSSQSIGIVTPPALSDLMALHTPSPASSNNLGFPTDASVDMQAVAAPPWTSAQFALIQQQVQQAQHAQLQQSQQAARQHHQQSFNPMNGNTFNLTFGQQLHSDALHQQQQQQSINAMPMLATDGFTQSLVASMFPQHGKTNAGLGPVTLEEIQKALNTGVGLGFGMVNNGANPSNPWLQAQNPPVEGF